MKVVTFSGVTHQYLDDCMVWIEDSDFLLFTGTEKRGHNLILPKSDIKYIEQ